MHNSRGNNILPVVCIAASPREALVNIAALPDRNDMPVVRAQSNGQSPDSSGIAESLLLFVGVRGAESNRWEWKCGPCSGLACSLTATCW